MRCIFGNFVIRRYDKSFHFQRGRPQQSVDIGKMASAHDNEILNHIFNPLLPTPDGEAVFQRAEEGDEGEPADELIPEPETAVVKLYKSLEIEGVKAAESGKLNLALDLFTQAIQIPPPASLLASGYNNRAQTFRLLGQINEAKDDLNNAINLSEGKGRAGCQAFCQRGLIYLKEGKEDDARKDFEGAAKLGSQFAKAQLVQLNPYAALCNKMLKQMFTKVRTGCDLAENQNGDNEHDDCDYKMKD